MAKARRTGARLAGRTKAERPIDKALTDLVRVLGGLDAAGPDGLEGLLRDAMQAVTGQTFKIAKSGPQGGMDLRTDHGTRFKLGLESKRYAAGARPLGPAEGQGGRVGAG